MMLWWITDKGYFCSLRHGKSLGYIDAWELGVRKGYEIGEETNHVIDIVCIFWAFSGCLLDYNPVVNSNINPSMTFSNKTDSNSAALIVFVNSRDALGP